jgi:hypothetical protein
MALSRDHWKLTVPTAPIPLIYKDGFATVDDCYNTSHDFSVIHKFSDGITMDVTSHGDNGITFEGSKGRIFVNRGKIVGKPIEENWDKDVLHQRSSDRVV